MNKLMVRMATVTLALGACADVTTPDVGSQTFEVKIENIAPWTVLESGVQAMKTNGNMGGAGPGDAFDISFTAGRNQKISFVSMFGESNDWFFAPDPSGIPLYDTDGNPITGDVTAQIKLWDAGTEIDQEPAVGDATGPQQPSPEFGAADPQAVVRTVPKTVTLTDGSVFTRPDVSQMIRVSLSAGRDQSFTLHVENVSTSTTLVTSQGSRAIHISPPVYATHIASGPLFDLGAPDRGQGVEQVAESGRATALVDVLRGLTGVATPLSPGVFVIHRDPNALYQLGVADRGAGLENLAEDADPANLLANTQSTERQQVTLVDEFDTPIGAHSPAPAFAGDAYSFTIDAAPGDRLSFATMFGMSNDWFFATGPEGLALYADDGTPMNGDVTDQIGIYDAGTEIDETLGIGPDVGTQQRAPNTGAPDPINQVREVGSSIYGFRANAHLRVTLTPM